MSGANPAEFPTRPALMEAAADYIAAALQQALDARGAACAALSGGATPEPAYIMLAQRDLDWPRVTFALVDERFVPPDHEASNEALLRRTLAPALEKGARLLPMYTPAPNVREAAERTEAAYASLAIDVALMGMGPDGHTASWFPQTDALEGALDAHNPRSVIAVHAPQATGSADRLTLTFSALSRIPRVGLLITGREKHQLVLEAYMNTARAPVGMLFRHPAGFPQVFWAE